MKKNFYLLCVLSFLFIASFCNQRKNKADTKDQAAELPPVTKMTRDHGKKWVDDSVTASNYIDPRLMTNMFAVNPFPALSNYQIFGSDLGKEINKMVQETTMQGAAHNILHRWSAPIIRQSNELKKASDTLVARKIFDSIRARVDGYTNYFED